MMDINTLEEEFESYITYIDNELNNIKQQENDLCVLNEKIFVDDSKNLLNYNQIKKDMCEYEHTNRNLAYLNFYHSLSDIQNEKDEFKKLEKLISIKKEFYQHQFEPNQNYVENLAFFKKFQEIIDADFSTIEAFLISIKYPLFEVGNPNKYLENILKGNKDESAKKFSYFYDYLYLLQITKFNKENFIESSDTDEFENKYQNIFLSDFNEMISIFLIKKIHFSIVLKGFTELEKLLTNSSQKSNELSINKTNSINNIIDGNFSDKELIVEKFFEDFFQNLTVYVKKLLENTIEFLKFCYEVKKDNYDSKVVEFKFDDLNKKEFFHFLPNFTIFLLESINFYLIKIFSTDKNYILYLSKSNKISLEFIRIFMQFEKNIKKQNFSKNNLLKYSALDIFLYSEPCFNQLKNILMFQKNFNSNYFNNNIAKILSEELKKDKFDFSFNITLFEKIKILIKDNFYLLDNFEKSSEIFSIIYQENYKYLFKEVNNLFKGFFNAQISYFISSRKINKLNIISLIDLNVKLLRVLSKYLRKSSMLNWKIENKKIFSDPVSENQTSSFSSEVSKNRIKLLSEKITNLQRDSHFSAEDLKIIHKLILENNIFFDALQNLNNFIILLTKEFKEKSFCKLIELFEYGILIKVSEDEIETVCHACCEDLKNLITIINTSNLNKEYEVIIYEIVLFDIISHLTEELEKSFQRKPKSKYFGLLADKVENIINLFASKIKNENNKNLIFTLKKFNSSMDTLKMNTI